MVTSETTLRAFVLYYLDGSCIACRSLLFAILFCVLVQLAGTGYCKRHKKNQALKHILSFRMKYFDLVPVGQLVTRSVSDIESIARILVKDYS
jgi:hypothetical protein